MPEEPEIETSELSELQEHVDEAHHRAAKVAIALGAVSAIAKSKSVWFGPGVVGIVGIVSFVLGFRD